LNFQAFSALSESVVYAACVLKTAVKLHPHACSSVLHRRRSRKICEGFPP
jgi:hypothetical protein